MGLAHGVHVIGFAGPAGVGKSAAAGLLAVHGYRVMSFADPLRALALELRPEWSLLDLTGPTKDTRPTPDASTGARVVRGPGLSPRETLRVLGDHVRGLCPAALVEAMARRIDAALSDGTRVVVDDVRMPLEADLLRDLGTLVHLRRDGVSFRRDHATELALLVQPGDVVLRNPGTVQTFAAELHQLLGDLQRRTERAA